MVVVDAEDELWISLRFSTSAISLRGLAYSARRADFLSAVGNDAQHSSNIHEQQSLNRYRVLLVVCGLLKLC